MALSVQARIHGAASAPSVYYDPSWLRTMESMLDQIAARSDNSLIDIEPTMGLRYQGDLYGLLMVKQISPEYHWVIMRANGYTSPEEYDGTRLRLLRPSDAFVEENMTLFSTYYKKMF